MTRPSLARRGVLSRIQAPPRRRWRGKDTGRLVRVFTQQKVVDFIFDWSKIVLFGRAARFFSGVPHPHLLGVCCPNSLFLAGAARAAFRGSGKRASQAEQVSGMIGFLIPNAFRKLPAAKADRRVDGRGRVPFCGSWTREMVEPR